ncbi:hypothetical protein CPB85DRAFT_1255107 [Mucidula mucida]|nr:hypothetical protein CPB85DRAFT_1255107 [Mucidula mucida]
MADTIDSNTASQTPNTASLSSNPRTPPWPHIWNNTNTQNQTPVVKKIAEFTEKTKGHYLVGMSPKEFMEIFMPWNVDTPDTYQKKLDSISKKQQTSSTQQLHCKFVKPKALTKSTGNSDTVGDVEGAANDPSLSQPAALNVPIMAKD